MKRLPPECDYGHLAGECRILELGGSDIFPPSGNPPGQVILCRDHWDAEMDRRKGLNNYLSTGTKWHITDWNTAEIFKPGLEFKKGQGDLTSEAKMLEAIIKKIKEGKKT